MRKRFDAQLAELNSELISMGSLCEEAIASAAKAALAGDVSLVKKVGELEEEIGHKERTIEALCLKLLLQQQPVARDLRQISAALKMITDMERIGVQAADVAEICGYLNGRALSGCAYIGDMARSTIKMVSESVDAYVKRDTDMAEAVIQYDDTVDELFCMVKGTLIELLAADPCDGEFALDLLMIAKYFERIGDHAVNIAQWVLFSVTGIHKGMDEL